MCEKCKEDILIGSSNNTVPSIYEVVPGHSCHVTSSHLVSENADIIPTYGDSLEVK